MTNPAQVSVEEVTMMIGQRDIEIFSLQKQLQAAKARIAELEKPKEDKAA